MTLLNTRAKYGLISLALHWIIVFTILAQWLLAEDGGSNALALHQSIGLVVLALAVVRVAWQMLNPTPRWPPDTKPFEAVLARSVHVAFYLLLFAIPISGWALASVEDEALRFFNWFDVPRVVLASEDTMEEVHETLFNILGALAVLHVIGAMKHWVVGRRTTELR